MRRLGVGHELRSFSARRLQAATQLRAASHPAATRSAKSPSAQPTMFM